MEKILIWLSKNVFFSIKNLIDKIDAIFKSIGLLFDIILFLYILYIFGIWPFIVFCTIYMINGFLDKDKTNDKVIDIVEFTKFIMTVVVILYWCFS